MSTTNLKLTLPAAGTSGWGESVNSNFTKIDTEYGVLKNQINKFDMRAGTMGMYYQDPQYDGVLYPLSSTQFKLKLANGTAGPTLTDALLETLLDGTYFIIDLDQTTYQSVTYNNIIFKDGDIAVKLSSVVNGNRTHTLNKLPQTIGGFYKLTAYEGTNYPKAKYQAIDAAKKNETVNLTTSPVLVATPTSVNHNHITFLYQSIDSSGIKRTHGTAATIAYPQIITKAYTADINGGDEIIQTDINSNDYTITQVTFTIDNNPAFLSYKIIEGYSYDIDVTEGAKRLPSGVTATMYVHYADIRS